MTNLYRGHNAKYWHGRYVQVTSVYLEALLEIFRLNPEFKEDLFCQLDVTNPGWRETLKEFMSGQRKPFHVQAHEEYGEGPNVPRL